AEIVARTTYCLAGSICDASYSRRKGNGPAAPEAGIVVSATRRAARAGAAATPSRTRRTASAGSVAPSRSTTWPVIAVPAGAPGGTAAETSARAPSSAAIPVMGRTSSSAEHVRDPAERERHRDEAVRGEERRVHAREVARPDDRVLVDEGRDGCRQPDEQNGAAARERPDLEEQYRH